MAKLEFIKMPLAELTAPKDGRTVYTDRWWVVTEQNEVLFFKGYFSPQCNQHKSIAEKLADKESYKGCRVEYIPVAYVPHSCSDYR